MSSIITSAFRFFQARTFINSFAYDTSENNIYLGLSKPTAWEDEYSPDTPTESPRDNKSDWDEMIAMKKVVFSHIHSVIPRYDWQSGVVYAQWDDSDMDIWNRKFYVLTDAYNIYKCIYSPINSKGEHIPSTYCPASTQTSGTFKTDDGYIWKFMGRVENVDVPYLSNQWIPVKQITEDDESRQKYAQAAIQEQAIKGTVDSVIFKEGAVVTIGDITKNATTGELTNVSSVLEVVGDGSGATVKAYAVMKTDGTVDTSKVNIIVTANGSGYTWAELQTTDTAKINFGTNDAYVVCSPQCGHGGNIVEELGGFYTMITVNFVQEEDSNVTVENDYRKLILVCNPTDGNGNLLTGSIYDLRTHMHYTQIADGIKGDSVVVHKGTDFSGTVIDINRDTKMITLINTTYNKNPQTGPYELKDAQTSGTSAVPTVIVDSIHKNPYSLTGTSVKKYSGQILYKDYRKVISRADDQTEQINIIFEF